MSDVIVIASGKGGVGKTSLTANLGVALSRLGKKVLLIDADIGLRNLDIALGLENKIVYDIVDVVSGECEPLTAVIKDKRFEGLFFLPAAQTKDKDDVSAEQMNILCNKVKDDYDFVLIDCPSGIDRGFKAAVSPADRALIVTTPEISAIRDAERVAGILEAGGIKDFRVVINRIRPDMVKSGEMMSVDEILELLNIDLIGIIPEDPGMFAATNGGNPIVGAINSIAAAGCRNIAERLCGNHVPLMDVDEKKFLKGYKKVFGKRKR